MGEELKQLKIKWQKFCMQDKYRLPGNDCYLMRWDVARAQEDGQKIPEYKALLDRLIDLIRADYPVRHKFVGRGVELSPAGNPMDDKNICVDVQDGGIPVALDKVKETGKMLVSKDVYGQLIESQRQKIAEVDGVHQYATGETGKVSLNNPTGYWVTGSGDVGHPITLVFTLMQMIVPSATFDVGTKMKEVYGLLNGRYQIGTAGVKRLGDCNGAGDDEKTIRSKIENFTLRDKRGYHGSDHTMYGQCSWKIDGIFCYLKARAGEAVLQFRNGAKWIGKSSHDIECAFEKVGDILYLLYVDVYKNNTVHLNKDLQDYFREQIEFKVNLKMRGGMKEQFLHSTKVADNLPRDGIVIWGLLRQNFFKEINTVDITKSMAALLIKEDEIVVEKFDELEDGKIYEFGVADTMHLVFIKERDPLSKILPNMLKSVRRTLDDPNLSAVRDHHAACPKENNNCEICKYI